MRFIKLIVIGLFLMGVSVSAHAQRREANTSSARAVYSMPPGSVGYKAKKKKKDKPQRRRKAKKQKTESDRVRRSAWAM